MAKRELLIAAAAAAVGYIIIKANKKAPADLNGAGRAAGTGPTAEEYAAMQAATPAGTDANTPALPPGLNLTTPDWIVGAPGTYSGSPQASTGVITPSGGDLQSIDESIL